MSTGTDSLLFSGQRRGSRCFIHSWFLWTRWNTEIIGYWWKQQSAGWGKKMHSLGETRGLSFELEKHEQEVRTASSCYLTYGCLFSPVRGLTEWATEDRLRAFLCTQSEGNANDMLDVKMTWCPQTAKQPNQTCASSRLTVIKCRGALLQPSAPNLLMEHQRTHTKASDSHICWWGGSKGWSLQKPVTTASSLNPTHSHNDPQ